MPNVWLFVYAGVMVFAAILERRFAREIGFLDGTDNSYGVQLLQLLTISAVPFAAIWVLKNFGVVSSEGPASVTLIACGQFLIMLLFGLWGFFAGRKEVLPNLNVPFEQKPFIWGLFAVIVTVIDLWLVIF